MPNRRWLDDYLLGALDRARSARKRVALLFIDLDNFKHINDTMGHAACDELLRAAAVCLKSAVRGSDHVVRLGGDGFTVLVENLERDARQLLRQADLAMYAVKTAGKGCYRLVAGPASPFTATF
ncbi:MAG: GGDEF domain-containing protein [Burkholderiaceae bacterium]|nr:GGDEF domain-containing protein [Burkholderiaceae bacterium]